MKFGKWIYISIRKWGKAREHIIMFMDVHEAVKNEILKNTRKGNGSSSRWIKRRRKLVKWSASKTFSFSFSHINRFFCFSFCALDEEDENGENCRLYLLIMLSSRRSEKSIEWNLNGSKMKKASWHKWQKIERSIMTFLVHDSDTSAYGLSIIMNIIIWHWKNLSHLRTLITKIQWKSE